MSILEIISALSDSVDGPKTLWTILVEILGWAVMGRHVIGQLCEF